MRKKRKGVLLGERGEKRASDPSLDRKKRGDAAIYCREGGRENELKLTVGERGGKGGGGILLPVKSGQRIRKKGGGKRQEGLSFTKGKKRRHHY